MEEPGDSQEAMGELNWPGESRLAMLGPWPSPCFFFRLSGTRSKSLNKNSALYGSFNSFTSVAVHKHHCHQNYTNQLKTQPKLKDNIEHSPQTDFVMAVISGPIPTWKPMKNYHIAVSHLFNCPK